MALMKFAKFSAGGFSALAGLSLVRAHQQTETEDSEKRADGAELPNVYFILKQGNSLIGTIVMELRSDIAPKTSENFRETQVFRRQKRAICFYEINPNLAHSKNPEIAGRSVRGNTASGTSSPTSTAWCRAS